jgi:hypothetical protein
MGPDSKLNAADIVGMVAFDYCAFGSVALRARRFAAVHLRFASVLTEVDLQPAQHTRRG